EGREPSRLWVQSVGYDRRRRLPYLVADVEVDVAKGSLLHNKTHAGVMRMDTYAHTESQMFDFLNWRHHYSQGDTYLMDNRFFYSGDVHSTGGDENGVVYGAFVISESAFLKAKVAAWDAASGALRFTGAGETPKVIGSGRPIINMNRAKWVTR